MYMQNVDLSACKSSFLLHASPATMDSSPLGLSAKTNTSIYKLSFIMVFLNHSNSKVTSTYA